MKKWFLFTSFIMTLQGCNEPDVPKCSDQNTKDLVLKVVTPRLKTFSLHETLKSFIEKLEYVHYNNMYNWNYTLLLEVINSPEKYPMKKKDRETFKDIKKHLDQFDDISLNAIRSNKINEKLQKSECSANLVFNSKKVPITYDVQITSDKNLYVNVYGL